MGLMNRNTDIDIGKGICIILMVVGHSGCPQWLFNWIYTFHMPFFFFVSGYLFSDKSLNVFIPFLKKKMKGLWWPFLKWNVIFILLHNLFFSLSFEHGKYTWIEIFKKIILSGLMAEPEVLLGTFWFLQQLIRVSIIAWVLLWIYRYLSKFSNKLLIVWMNMAIALLTFLAYVIDFRVPGVVSKLTMLSLLFYFTGYTLRVYMSALSRYLYSNFFLLVCVFVTICGSICNSAEMSTVPEQRVIPYWVVGILGCVMVLNISRRVSGTKMSLCIDYIGRHTLSIMVWHFFIFKVVSILLEAVHIIPHEDLLAFPVPSVAHDGWWMLYTILGVFLSLLMGKVTDKLGEIVKSIV